MALLLCDDSLISLSNRSTFNDHSELCVIISKVLSPLWYLILMGIL